MIKSVEHVKVGRRTIFTTTSGGMHLIIAYHDSTYYFIDSNNMIRKLPIYNLGLGFITAVDSFFFNQIAVGRNMSHLFVILWGRRRSTTIIFVHIVAIITPRFMLDHFSPLTNNG